MKSTTVSTLVGNSRCEVYSARALELASRERLLPGEDVDVPLPEAEADLDPSDRGEAIGWACSRTKCRRVYRRRPTECA